MRNPVEERRKNMTAMIYDFNDLKEKNQRGVNLMDHNNITESDFYNIVNNAVASLLMSLEEDGVNSEHPLITYKMIPELGNVVEKYLRKIIDPQN